MKLFVKFLIVVVLLALAGPFFLKGPDGLPLWRWQDAVAKFNHWRSGAVSNTVGVVIPEAGSVKVYRWQDEAGQWHFSNEPPANQNADVLLINPATNVVQAAKPREPEEEAPVEDPADDIPESAHISPILPLPDPETTQQLLQDVRELQDLAEQRKAAMDNIQ
ncbi:MAG: DUF4124 domain-containing protein [Pseudomonadota bacterium]